MTLPHPARWPPVLLSPSLMRSPFRPALRRALVAVCLAVAGALLPGATLPAAAQSRVSTSAAPFLTLGAGARGSALGQAYTALAAGADALFWNPAGAARVAGPGGRGGVFLSHTSWLLDTDYNTFALTVPVTAAGVFGFSIGQLDYGRMDVTTVDLPDGTGETFGASDLVIGVSYAQPLTNRFYLGGTVKYVRQAIYDMTASTAAFDVGFVLESDYFNGMRLAASIMNFGGLMRMQGVNSRVFVDIDETSSGSNDGLPAQLETLGWELPLSFKFGAAWPVVRTNSVRFELLTDAHQTNDNDLNADLGGELRFAVGPVTLDLRAGYKDLALDNVDAHLTYGGGIDLRAGGLRFGADYGYVPFDALGNVSMIDLRLAF